MPFLPPNQQRQSTEGNSFSYTFNKYSPVSTVFIQSIAKESQNSSKLEDVVG